jgi:hypothetical protein
VVGHVLASVIRAHGKTTGDALAERAEAAAHTLPDRLEGFEACGPVRGVDADALQCEQNV